MQRESKSLMYLLILTLTLSALFLFYFYYFPDNTIPDNTICSFSLENMDEYDADAPLIKYTGRFDFKEGNTAIFSQSGSVISWSFSGKNCIIRLRNYSTDPKNYSSNYFYVFVDDNDPIVLHATNDSDLYYLTGLGKGQHYLRLYKRTESACGKCEFYGFYIDKNEDVYPMSDYLKLKIEFVGNSITAGYGNEDSLGGRRFRPEFENHYYSYAAFCARELFAEYHSVCFSGKGVYRNYDLSEKEVLPALYLRTYHQKNMKWDFSKWQPDIVVLNAGTNDFAQGIPPRDSFIISYFHFLQTIRKKNSNAAIVVIDGPLLKNGLKTDTLDGSQEQTYSIYKYCLNQAINNFRNAGNGNIFQFSLTPVGKLGYGTNWHPSKAQHEFNGKELADFIKKEVLLMNDPPE